MQPVPKHRFTRIDGIAITLAVCAGLCCVLAIDQAQNGLLVFPFVIAWVAVTAYFAHKMRAITRFVCMLIGVVSLAGIVLTQGRLGNAEQAKADAIVLLIQEFHAQHQRYPQTLDEVGITKAELEQRLGKRAHYTFYPSEDPVFRRSGLLLDYYSYNFKTSVWDYQPD